MTALFNIEIKARCPDPDAVRAVLTEMGARALAVDHQVDTYYHCAAGRLKLRQSRHGDQLIHYLRDDTPAPKASDILLESVADGPAMRALLARALGVLVVVDKRREIFFVDNVKLHIDELSGFGSFVEIEVLDTDGSIGRERLLDQCRTFMRALGVADDHLVSRSYSDLLLEI